MSLNAEQVTKSYKLMTGALLPAAEAHRRAELLWSREELLAALIVRDEVLKPHPELEALLMAIAERAYASPRSPRPERGDGIQKHKVAQQVTDALERLLATERERIAITETVQDAMRQQALAWADPASHPGYQWCVGHEPRG